MTPPTPPISPAEPLPPVAPTSRLPSGPQRLLKALYNPTYLAILASVGLHGLAVASLPVVTPIITGGIAKPQGPIETNIVQLTPAEAARVRSAFPAPRTTAQPPAFPYFNNSNSQSSTSPPPLSGGPSKSTRTGPDWASILGGNSSSADSEIYGDSSGYDSDEYTRESDSTGNEYYNYSGDDYTSDGGYAYNPDDYVNIEDFVNSPPPPPNNTDNTDKTPAKQPQNRQAANNGKKPDDRPENREVANADGTRDDRNIPDNNWISLGTTVGVRGPQDPWQKLEGDFPIVFNVKPDGTIQQGFIKPDGTVQWNALSDDPLVQVALEETLAQRGVSVSRPGEYILTVVYPPLESDPNTNVAEGDPDPTPPTKDPDLVALQEDYPDYESLVYDPIEISAEVSTQAKVAIRVDAEGNAEPIVVQSTGTPELDERAIEEAFAQFDPSQGGTIQTFEIQFNTPEDLQPQPEKPTPPQTSEPAPADPSPEPSEESTPESDPELEDKVPPQTPIEPEAGEEEPTIESDPPSNPKKKPADPQSALPSL